MSILKGYDRVMLVFFWGGGVGDGGVALLYSYGVGLGIILFSYSYMHTAICILLWHEFKQKMV